MTATELAELRGLFAMYAAYYRQQMPDEVIAMYADDLADLGLVAVRDALDRYRKNPKNRTMPMPAQIREMLSPEVDVDSAAREIAARIEGAIVKHGWCNAQGAREMIGEVGWSIVERCGGWMHLCQNHGITIDPTAFAAQTRELAKAHLKYTPPQIQQAIQAGMGREISGFIGELVKDLNDV